MSTIPGSFGASHPQSVPEINQPPEPSPGRALIARVWGPEGGHFPTEREVRRFTALFRYHEIPEDNEKACQNFCREYRLCFPLTEKADPEAVAAFLDRLTTASQLCARPSNTMTTRQSPLFSTPAPPSRFRPAR